MKDEADAHDVKAGEATSTRTRARNGRRIPSRTWDAVGEDD